MPLPGHYISSGFRQQGAKIPFPHHAVQEADQFNLLLYGKDWRFPCSGKHDERQGKKRRKRKRYGNRGKKPAHPAAAYPSIGVSLGSLQVAYVLIKCLTLILQALRIHTTMMGLMADDARKKQFFRQYWPDYTPQLIAQAEIA